MMESATWRRALRRSGLTGRYSRIGQASWKNGSPSTPAEKFFRTVGSPMLLRALATSLYLNAAG
jgi:hypothetical protein